MLKSIPGLKTFTLSPLTKYPQYGYEENQVFSHFQEGFRSALWKFVYFEFVILEIRILKRCVVSKEHEGNM